MLHLDHNRNIEHNLIQGHPEWVAYNNGSISNGMDNSGPGMYSPALPPPNDSIISGVGPLIGGTQPTRGMISEVGVGVGLVSGIGGSATDRRRIGDNSEGRAKLKSPQRPQSIAGDPNPNLNPSPNLKPNSSLWLYRTPWLR